jgi:hypothetical protein
MYLKSGYLYSYPNNFRGYRFSFNGQEKDDEVSGEGNTMSAEFWEYDSRLGRRWNVDPKPSPSISVYTCFANNPILFTDVNGDTIGIILFSKRGKDKEFFKAAKTLAAKLDGKNDGVFVIYGHGNNKGVEYADKNDNVQAAYKPEELNIVLSEKSPEWKSAMKGKKDVTLIMYACNTAARNYYDTHTKREYPVSKTFAEKVSERFSNVNVVAANGHVLFIPRQNGQWELKVRNSLLQNGRMVGIGKERRTKNEEKD